MTYTTAEEQIRQKILAVEAFGMSDTDCGTSLDGVYSSLIRTNNLYGCILNFAGGGRKNREPFAGGSVKGRIWVWRTYGILLIRYLGDLNDLEDQVRVVIEELKGLLDDDRRLGGTADYAELVSIDGPPEDITLNDTAFLMIGFTVEFWEKA